MTLLALIRHGPTEWNITGLVQGSTDIPLNEAGAVEVAGWKLPKEFAEFRWLASPLKRAYQTASLLAGFEPDADERLVEMAWGDWEGRTLSDLREELGDLMVAWEAKGLDFHGPNGESPRDVQQRMAPLLQEIAAQQEPTIAVTHKGFIRAFYATAIDWDMVDKPPVKLLDGCVQLFKLDETGHPSVEKLNIQMTAK
ncbi:MAG: histidine phosphatase family protein [Rhodospirillaceae bacterium]|nr:histidine phosphatase family protein [Rhodospirillaceae bacterium]MBT4588024.1 histidine phosphatase family protein [Rhodospirillaceae bacterium]MBT4937769.1 histidine phosphatase family protein [Rhodospirillaceae bacterium]MBT5941090.1 histidine phosphatase family protein [Rhodospirillaceae bacterium]MBT7266095.1 histidine phosphatase family protein [Rhodospirillaceae bacterium]